MDRKAAAAAALIALVLAAPQAARGQEQEKERKARAGLIGQFAGSAVSLSHYASLVSFDAGAELTHNPTITQMLILAPRFQLNEKIRITGELRVITELTNSDETVSRREPQLSDLLVNGSYKLPELHEKVGGRAALFVALPTSPQSRAEERIATTGVTVQLGRTFELSGDIALRPELLLRGSYNVGLEQSVIYESNPILGCQSAGDSVTCEPLTHAGGRAVRAGFREGIGVTAELPYRLGVQVQALWVQSWLYPLADAVDPFGQPIPTSETNVNWRYTMVYELGVEWEALEHLLVGGGLSTLAPQLAPSSDYYRPFINRYTEAFVTATVVY